MFTLFYGIYTTIKWYVNNLAISLLKFLILGKYDSDYYWRSQVFLIVKQGIISLV